jgi:hypothetical protein
MGKKGVKWGVFFPSARRLFDLVKLLLCVELVKGIVLPALPLHSTPDVIGGGISTAHLWFNTRRDRGSISNAHLWFNYLPNQRKINNPNRKLILQGVPKSRIVAE